MARSGLYLGTTTDGAKEILVEPRELTTHGFCVGMTGSGKTGLCSVLIEEVLAQGIPVIAVDPKGDLGNLLLALDPEAPQEFLPWVDPDAARREKKTEAELAEALAKRSREGFAQSRLSSEDFGAYRKSHVCRIYTPGARIGIPVNVIGSLAPPSDGGDLSEAVDGSVRAILGLLGLDADPVRSREYILLFQIIDGAWKEKKALALADLVRLAAEPPFDAIGALPLETFFAKKDRTALVMALNGLVASPPFEAWRTGEPLDIAAMLRAPDGRPCLSVYSTAHLPEEQRLFATALLLEKVKAWAQRQPGTQDLRALIYLDEIYGYFPPHPYDPPTKKPLLTLLKQARAFGVGVVLATQNPVDLDYKGLANIGTWFVGTLQTDQDKARIRDGLNQAASAAGQSPKDVDALLSGVEKRVFLHHSIHRGAPALLRSRYAYSFLRGPLSREEIGRLSGKAGAVVPAVAPLPVSGASAAAAAPAASSHAVIPSVDEALGPLFQDTEGPASPFLLVKFAVRYRVNGVATEERTFTVAYPLLGTASQGEALEGQVRSVDEQELKDSLPPALRPLGGPPWLRDAKLPALTRIVKDRMPSKLEAKLWFDAATNLLSFPTESRKDFTARVAADQADAKSTAAATKKLEKKRLELVHAQEMVEARKKEKWASMGGALVNNLGLIFGKKRTISGVSGVMSKGRLEDQAENKVETLTAEIAVLEEELARAGAVDPARFEERRVLPVAKDLDVLRVAVCYLA